MKLKTIKNGKTWEIWDVTEKAEYLKTFFTLEAAEAFMAGVYFQAERIAVN